MEFQWVIDCDQFGVKSEPELQYRENEDQDWMTVPTVEVKTVS